MVEVFVVVVCDVVEGGFYVVTDVRAMAWGSRCSFTITIYWVSNP